MSAGAANDAVLSPTLAAAQFPDMAFEDETPSPLLDIVEATPTKLVNDVDDSTKEHMASIAIPYAEKCIRLLEEELKSYKLEQLQLLEGKRKIDEKIKRLEEEIMSQPASLPAEIAQGNKH